MVMSLASELKTLMSSGKGRSWRQLDTWAWPSGWVLPGDVLLSIIISQSLCNAIVINSAPPNVQVCSRCYLIQLFDQDNCKFFKWFWLDLYIWPSISLAKNLPQCHSSVQLLSRVWLFLCNHMNHSTPGLSVHHQLPEFTQTHVHRVLDANSAIKSL